MQIQLHTAEQDLLLDNIRLIFEILSETAKNLIGILDHLDVLADDPDYRGLCLWVV